MKNILTTLAILITAFAFAQDGYKLSPDAYQALNAKVSNLDTLEARALADRMAGSATSEFVYLQSSTTDKAVKYYYSRTDLSPEAQKDQDEMGCSNCFVVYFRNMSNSLTFWQVAGNFDELQPVWQGVFLKDATPENTKGSFRYREVKDRNTGTDIRFSKATGSWQIYNWTK